MVKPQTKNIIGRILFSLLFLFLGEGLFGVGVYWPFILSLITNGQMFFLYGFVFGIVVSVVTGSELGKASLLIVIGLFIYDRLRNKLSSSLWLIGLLAMFLSLVTDSVLGLSWSFWEGLFNFGLVWFLGAWGYFDETL